MNDNGIESRGLLFRKKAQLIVKKASKKDDDKEFEPEAKKSYILNLQLRVTFICRKTKKSKSGKRRGKNETTQMVNIVHDTIEEYL